VPEPTYTHGHHESVLRSHRWRTVENSAAYLAPHLRPGQSLLDVGCGPGNITVDLAQRVTPGAVAGIDASADVIAQAIADAPADVDVRFEVADVYALPFDDGAFDVVHAHQVLQHLPHQVTALGELRRVCAPDGVVAARDGDYASFTWFPSDPLLDRWLEVYSHVARRNRGEPDAGRRLLHWARAAGFSEVEPSASVWCFATPEDRSWWGGLWADRVTESALHHQAIDFGIADADELHAMADAWRRWAEQPDGWFAVVHGEVLCRG
jgi:ubiquinone/menaquinone biosynthesis C-methylase UbiE